MIINGMEIVKGFNINDKEQDFTEQILEGVKTEETRRTHSLDSLIGKRVAIIRTGRGKAVIVGTCVIAGCAEYRSEEEWRRGYERHRVSKGSRYDFTGRKVGYALKEVESVKDPIPVTAKGIVIRNL